VDVLNQYVDVLNQYVDVLIQYVDVLNQSVDVLKGHDFSRAANATKRTRALAPEGTGR
jgi:hypothetical protein